ncbi:MAG: DUF4268 domain-containing protein [Chloroflexota bacterium]|nr:DUF4268 domain-containing protein [Chloroflexota bacterium]MDE2921022.1 DUF4268 domain-containing protein [Chloroflexota bacterium]
MTEVVLSRLKPVDLRRVWQSEPGDFTPWLAESENITLLGETLGLELDVESTEAGVGPFRADIVCRDTGDGSPEGSLVLIENQLERTDHNHLGQLLTYAAGLDAVTVVWIAAPFTDEHRAALDWLNQKTEKGVNFFGLEIELWKISDSPIAPKFNIVAKPNDWSTSLVTDPAISETKRQQLEFWIEFEALVKSQTDNIRCQKPGPQHWMNHPIGRSWITFASVISTSPPFVRVELSLNGDDAKTWLSLLEGDSKAIADAIGEQLIWHNPPNSKRAGIQVRNDLDFRNESQRQVAKEWLYERLETFHEVLKPRALELNAADAPAAASEPDVASD